MTVNISYTEVVYNVYRPDVDNADIAHRERCVMNIYDGRVTNARIARELPKGAVVEKVTRVDKRFYVVGKKLFDWLAENGTEPEKD